MVKKLKEIYRGKAKTMYETNDPNVLYCEFRDDISAFNAEKLDTLEKKGQINNFFNAYIMQHLEKAGIKTHFVDRVADNATLVKNLKMYPLECVVRNRAAGSLCKRLGIEKNTLLNPPIFEFFYKDDALGDPLINESHVVTFGWASAEEMQEMKRITFKVNEVLMALFAASDLILADYKLEFGKYHGDIVLADEFTPDGCRIWDANTLESLDKDRFRQDLGSVVESYAYVANRLGIPLE